MFAGVSRALKNTILMDILFFSPKVGYNLK
jgi:hypothetical protein